MQISGPAGAGRFHYVSTGALSRRRAGGEPWGRKLSASGAKAPILAASATRGLKPPPPKEGGVKPPLQERPRFSGRGRHGVQELRIGLGFRKAAEQKLHGLDGRERAQHLAQNPDAAELVGRQE